MLSPSQPLRLLAIGLALSQVTNACSLNLRAAQRQKDVERGLLDGLLSATATLNLLGAGVASASSSANPSTNSAAATSSSSQSPAPTTASTTSTTSSSSSSSTPAETTSTSSSPPTTTAPTTTSSSATTPSSSDPTPSTTHSDALTTSTSSPSPTSSVVAVTMTTTVDGKPSTFVTSSTGTSSASKSTSSATLSQDTTQKTGMTTKTRNTIIGAVVGIAGAALILGLAVVAWRIWGRNRESDETAGLMGFGTSADSMAGEKIGGSTVGNSNRSPFQSTLESYHQPVHELNASSNF